MSLSMLFVLFLVLDVVTRAWGGGIESTPAPAACPCFNPLLCDMISAPPTRKEFYVFLVDNSTYRYYDWSKVTTVATFGDYDPELICTAHANNARVVRGVGYDVSQLRNLTHAALWFVELHNTIVSNYLDGVNIDIEDVLPPSEMYHLTELVANATSYLRERLPNVQVTFDVAWSPNCIDGRCYDYAGLADFTDFLVVMDYDLRSQILGPCVASANSPPNLVEAAMQNYTKLGIDPQKLVMGLPWYGYDYTCLKGTAPDATVCPIEKVPFRGVNCSDAAGNQLSVPQIKDAFQHATTNIHWNATLAAPWFNYQDPKSGAIHQMWYDDPKSLAIKVMIAKQLNLRGVGMWTGDFVDYVNDRQTADAYWAAMEIFF